MSSEIDDFIKWLESRDLFICNVSNAIFWPTDTEGLAARFTEARAVVSGEAEKPNA